MKTWSILTAACVAALCMSGIAYSDDDDDEHGHSDIEFVYEDGKIAIEFGDEGPVFEGEFPTEGLDLQFTTEPGFASELEEGGGINANDQIVYNLLDSGLLYWNDGFASVPNNAQIRIVNRPPSPVVPDTIVGTGTGVQMGSFDPPLNRVGAAEDDGDFHSDLDFFLEPVVGDATDPTLIGAYGFMLSVSTDAEGIADSEKFALVFNLGLEEEKFEEGVAAFANLVPEPSGGLLTLAALSCVVPFVRRRNRK